MRHNGSQLLNCDSVIMFLISSTHSTSYQTESKVTQRDKFWHFTLRSSQHFINLDQPRRVKTNKLIRFESLTYYNFGWMNRSHGSYVSDFAVLVVWTFDPTLLLVDRLVNADMVVRGDDCLGLQRLCRHTSYQHDCSNISAVIKRWRRCTGSDFALRPLGLQSLDTSSNPALTPGLVLSPVALSDSEKTLRMCRPPHPTSA